jgi:hypothetical protein
MRRIRCRYAFKLLVNEKGNVNHFLPLLAVYLFHLALKGSRRADFKVLLMPLQRTSGKKALGNQANAEEETRGIKPAQREKMRKHKTVSPSTMMKIT